MSIMNFITDTAMVAGLCIAIIGTTIFIPYIHHHKKATNPLVVSIIGIVMMIPYLLCTFYGAEYVETHDIQIYDYDDSYLTFSNNGKIGVWVEYDDEYYVQEFIKPRQIKIIEDDSQPRVQVVKTILRFGPFETSNSVNIIWVTEI